MKARPPGKRVLLAGFAPFDGETMNPAWQAVSALAGTRIAGHRVVACELPVEFGASLQGLHEAMTRSQPALVLCVGQAGGRSRMSLERVAINVDDARIADNAGAQPIDTPVVPGGPAAYFSTLPIKAMLAALRDAGIPAEVSQTAGTFVCNHVFYGLMHALRATPRVRGGFIHVPYAPAQAARRPGTPSLATGTVVEGLRVALRTSLTTANDRVLAAGTEC